MLELESLRVADIYRWLGTGEAAADHLGCNQSTISRHFRHVEQLRSALSEIGAQHLLSMERELHQKWRFSQGKHLRLHAYAWTNRFVRGHIPEQWEINLLRISATRKPGLQLLEERIIDAICAPYPLIANANPQQLAIFPLYESVLQILSSANCVLLHERGLDADDVAQATTLARLSYVPPEAAACSKALDGSLFTKSPAPRGNQAVAKRYWGTPLTPLITPKLQPVDLASPCPYAEYLVVLKDWESHPLVAQLQASIVTSMSDKIASTSAAETIQFAA